MGPRRAPALLALAAFLVVCAAVLPAPVVAVDMLRRAGDAAAATGAADGVAVIRAQCEHRISALEASSSAALREHEEKVASLTEERDDLAATVKRYKRGLLNLESKRKDEVAKLEQALRLAESGECPTPTLADYVAPALDSIRRAWSDALAGVTDARDVAARAVWSRTRSALAAGVGARRAVISRASAAARALFPDDTPHDDAHARETARTAVDVVIGAIVAVVIVAATSRMSSPFRAKSDRVGPTARTRIEVVDEDEEELRGGAVLEGDEGAVEWKTYRAHRRTPDIRARVEIEHSGAEDLWIRAAAGARGCPTPSQPRPRRSTINRKISTTRRSSPGRPRRRRRGTRRTARRAMTTRTTTARRRRIPSPPRKSLSRCSESERRPRGSPRASSRPGPRRRCRRSPRVRRAAAAAGGPAAPAPAHAPGGVHRNAEGALAA